MKLYIKMIDNSPVEYPITGENLQHLFPDANLETTCPPGYAVLEQTPMPTRGTYQIFDGSHYEINGAVVKEVWDFRDMTAAEKKEAQDAIKLNWTGDPAWVYNESKNLFEPPIAAPTDGKEYIWNKSLGNWVEHTHDENGLCSGGVDHG
jgi:hypothetical protein